MKELSVRITGIRPLILSNPQTVKLSNPFAVVSRKLTSELKAFRKKANEDKILEIEQKQMRNDWEASAYWDQELKMFYLPDTVLLAVIREGAKAAKKGKDIDRSVLITRTPQDAEGTIAGIKTAIVHKTLDQYFADEKFRIEGPCRIPPKTGALVWKCRCMIPTGYTIEFVLSYDEDVITEKGLCEAIAHAGSIGLCGWTPKFGRFTAEFLKAELAEAA